MIKSMIYVDNFSAKNSNKYWLASFRKYIPIVKNFDNRKITVAKICQEILKIKPDYIHFGGSIKSDMVFPVKFVENIRKQLPNTRITFFYGDAYFFPYQRNIIEHIDNLFISHKPSDIQSDKIIFMPCPTTLDPPSIKTSKLYEVTFIGNNYSPSRLGDLKRIAQVCDLTVFGTGWAKTGLKCKGPIRFEDFPKVVAQSKFCLGSTLYTPCEWSSVYTPCKFSVKPIRLCHNTSCKGYKSRAGYFSNRVMNLCASRACVLMLYSAGLEEIFTDIKDILFFNNFNNLAVKIKTYKNQIDELEKMGNNAYQLSRNYTFDNIAKKFIGE